MQKTLVLMMGLVALGCGGGGSSTGRPTISDIGEADGGVDTGLADGGRTSTGAGLADASPARGRDGSSDPPTATPSGAEGGPSSLPPGNSPDGSTILSLERRISVVH